MCSLTTECVLLPQNIPLHSLNGHMSGIRVAVKPAYKPANAFDDAEVDPDEDLRVQTQVCVCVRERTESERVRE